jgi:hypothetical protein
MKDRIKSMMSHGITGLERVKLVGISRAPQNSDESDWKKLDKRPLVVGIIAECVRPVQSPNLIPRVSRSFPLETKSMIRSLLGLGLIQHIITAAKYVWDKESELEMVVINSEVFMLPQTTLNVSRTDFLAGHSNCRHHYDMQCGLGLN